MPSRVRCDAEEQRARRRRQAAETNRRYHGIAHQSAERKRAGEPGGRGDAVHVVADEEAAQLLEDEDQPVGQQHLLQVVALVEEAEERPLEQVAEGDREHDAERDGAQNSRRTASASANAR